MKRKIAELARAKREKISYKRAAAARARITPFEKKERTPVERADYLLQGLKSSIKNFYSIVELRAGIGRNTHDQGIFCSEEPAYCSGNNEEADEFLSKTGFGPRDFLTKKYLKWMAYRLRKLDLVILDMEGEEHYLIMPGYRDMIKDLHTSGLYSELAIFNGSQTQATSL